MYLPLSTAFTELHRFGVVVFSFPFISMHILLSFLMDLFLNADPHPAVLRNIWKFEILASLTSSYTMLLVPSPLCEKQVLKDHGSSWQVACMRAQLCLTDSMDCSLPSLSISGILQARILEWVAMPSSRDLLDPGIKTASPMPPVLAGWWRSPSPPGKPPDKLS